MKSEGEYKVPNWITTYATETYGTQSRDVTLTSSAHLDAPNWWWKCWNSWLFRLDFRDRWECYGERTASRRIGAHTERIVNILAAHGQFTVMFPAAKIVQKELRVLTLLSLVSNVQMNSVRGRKISISVRHICTRGIWQTQSRLTLVYPVDVVAHK